MKMYRAELAKVLMFLVTQLRFVYSQWWDDYSSQYYSAYSQMGYPCSYSQDGYDYSSYGQAAYPYSAYVMAGSYGDYEHMYDSHYADAAQPIIIVVENVDKCDDFFIDDLISLLGLAKDLPNDYSRSCPSTWSCNSCDSCKDRHKGRDSYDFYSECNRGPKCNCESCRSSKKGCKKCGKSSECGCHRCEDSCCDRGCCRHIVICEY